MKKVILALAAIITLGTAANAQISTLGVRFGGGWGWGGELSAQWGMGGNRLETDLGIAGNYLNLTGIYQWTGNITGPFGWYAGVGASLGFITGNDGGLGLGVAAQVGLEFNPSFPLQFTLDFRPEFGLVGHSGFNPGWALGIRYRF
ncbi:MAG: hypothetical protein IJ789_05530 [Bacteroidales bacterium]|nr:hypothetical protein [Bacteroidales bacterium]